MDILIICVNYNSDADTLRFVEETLSLPVKGSVDIVVVDNSASQDNGGLQDVLKSKGPRVHYLRPGTNLGYFGAAHLGFRDFLKHNDMPAWVIVSNVDLEFPDNSLFIKLNSNTYDDKVAIIAPDIRASGSNCLQNPFMTDRPTRLRMLFYKFLSKNRVGLNAYEALSAVKCKIAGKFATQCNGLKPGRKKKIYAAHGSFIIFKKLYFECGGSLEYPSFLFGEEIFVSERTRLAGLDIVFDPSLRIIHNEHLSTRHFWSRKKAAHLAKSMKYCYDIFFK